MKSLLIFLVVVAILAVGIVMYLYARKPTGSTGIRDLGKDVRRDTRDAYNSVKDAAEDATDKVKDAVK